MELGIDDPKAELGRLERISQVLAAKETELRSREEVIRKERAALERAKKNLDAMNASAESLLSVLDRPLVEVGDDLMALAGDLASTPHGTAPYGEIKRAMKVIVKGMDVGSPFSSREVVTCLRMQYPRIKVDSNRANISSYLKDFEAEGLIEMTEEASGQRPAFFIKK
jgi:hypothetical protein